MLLLPTSWAVAAAAQASYGQMRLDGIGILLAFGLIVAWGLLVDIVLLARGFRHRAILIGALVLAGALILLFAGCVVSPAERTGFFKGAPGGAALVVLGVTGAVFVPFIVLAPIVQHRALARGRGIPGWIIAWMVLQVALLPGFIVLAHTESHFWQQEYAAGEAQGRAVAAGGLDTIRERAGQRHERIWGTGWTWPWRVEPSAGHPPRGSGWIAGVAAGLDSAALIAADEPLDASDRTALRALIDRHFAGVAAPRVAAKLIWDALEPGHFARQLAPRGLGEQGVVSDTVLPLLLDRLEGRGPTRVCPGGRMMDADRHILRELVLAGAQRYHEANARAAKAALDAKARERELSEAPLPFRLVLGALNALSESYGGQTTIPDWSGYPQRVAGICRGPA